MLRDTSPRVGCSISRSCNCYYSSSRRMKIGVDIIHTFQTMRMSVCLHYLQRHLHRVMESYRDKFRFFTSSYFFTDISKEPAFADTDQSLPIFLFSNF